MTRINFCTFNCRPVSIADQVQFMQSLFAEQYWRFTVSDCLAADALNFVIECFNPMRGGSNHVPRVNEFCRRHRKRVGVVMSEHIELETEGITFNGTPLHDMTYIMDKENRFFSLVGLSQYAMGFFTLGCLPALNSFDQILPRHRVYRLPFPTIDPAELAMPADREPAYDLVFTGAMTPYRRQVLNELSRRYSVHHSTADAIEDKRLAICRRGKLSLNIPQMPEWSWISPMRVIFGLRAGRATVHHGGELRRTTFSDHVETVLDIDAALRDWRGAHARQMQEYDVLATNFRRHMPLGLLEVWARLENVPFGQPDAPSRQPYIEPVATRPRVPMLAREW